MRLREGDKVKVISGKDAGKESRISKVYPKKDQVIVEGVNTAKRHTRPRGQTMQGGIVDKDMPIHVSNVMIMCEDCGRPVRISYRVDEHGKYRVCPKCGSDL
ncbi:MAG TPA: 50S ribosomal protein L24 [Acidimicrobiia bacterium]|jgi:large subunit ribosomal protein L24|nr:50S ribosomal protein L24 [Acidimicrobiia bacterium]